VGSDQLPEFARRIYIGEEEVIVSHVGRACGHVGLENRWNQDSVAMFDWLENMKHVT